MLRLIVPVLGGAALLSAGPTQGERLTKQEYVRAATRATDAPLLGRLSAQALDFEFPGQPPTRARWLGAERQMEPCFAARSRVCDRFYARGYSFG